MLPAE
jgi:ribosomal protein S1